MDFEAGTAVFMIFVSALIVLVGLFRLLRSGGEEDSETAKRKVFEDSSGNGEWVELVQSPYSWKIDLWAEGLKAKGIPAYSSSEHPYITDGAVFALQNKLFVPLDQFDTAKTFIEKWEKQTASDNTPEKL